MFAHKNSQATTSPGLSRSEYVKSRRQEAHGPQSVSNNGITSNQDNPTNSEDICFTSYSSFTVKPKSIKPMDLRDLQTYSVPASPEKRGFSNLAVSNLVSPMASLFNLDKTPEGSKSSESHTACGARYDTLTASEYTLNRRNSNPFLKESPETPRPSIDSLLEDFYNNASRVNTKETVQKAYSNQDEHEELVRSVLLDTEAFNALSLNEYKQLKQEYLNYNNTIETLRVKLQHEIRIRDGASSMVSAQTDKKMMEQAQEQLLNSERRVNQLSSELWRMTQMANHLQKTFLEHISAVLAESVRQGTSTPTTSTSSIEPSLSPDQSVAEVSINDISNISAQLNIISAKLNAYVRSYVADCSLNQTQHGIVHLNADLQHAPHNIAEASGLLSSPLSSKNLQTQDLTEQIVYLPEEPGKTNKEYVGPAKDTSSIKNISEKTFEHIIPVNADCHEHSNHATKDNLPANEDEKSQIIDRLHHQVEECLARIAQLDEEKTELLSSLRLLYLQVPDLSLSRESSISSQESGVNVEKLGRRIDRVIQENHRLLDRVVNLQDKNRRLKKDRYETISRKGGLHGIYKSSSLESNRLLQNSSGDEKE